MESQHSSHELDSNVYQRGLNLVLKVNWDEV